MTSGRKPTTAPLPPMIPSTRSALKKRTCSFHQACNPALEGFDPADQPVCDPGSDRVELGRCETHTPTLTTAKIGIPHNQFVGEHPVRCSACLFLSFVNPSVSFFRLLLQFHLQIQTVFYLLPQPVLCPADQSLACTWSLLSASFQCSRLIDDFPLILYGRKLQEHRV